MHAACIASWRSASEGEFSPATSSSERLAWTVGPDCSDHGLSNTSCPDLVRSARRRLSAEPAPDEVPDGTYFSHCDAFRTTRLGHIACLQDFTATLKAGSECDRPATRGVPFDASRLRRPRVLVSTSRPILLAPNYRRPDSAR